jgi:hypothetical protein
MLRRRTHIRSMIADEIVFEQMREEDASLCTDACASLPDETTPPITNYSSEARDE